MKFIPVVLIAIVAFLVGLSIKSNFISPFNAVSTSEEASDSAQISTTSGNVPQLSNEAAPAGTVQSKNGKNYISQNLPDKIVMSGRYKLSTYNVNFNVTLPKNGGDITGTLTGTCEGTITGKVEKPNAEGFAPLEGKYSGDCKPIPTLGFKTRASGIFDGKASFKEGKAAITTFHKEPFETQIGPFELFF